jgi:hypothetical protein
MAVEVNVNTAKLSALIRELAPSNVQQLLARAGLEAEGLAKTQHKYKDRTGYLTSSARTDISHPGEVWVGHSALYAPYVEAWDAFLEPAVKKAVEHLIAALENIFRRAM